MAGFAGFDWDELDQLPPQTDPRYGLPVDPRTAEASAYDPEVDRQVSFRSRALVDGDRAGRSFEFSPDADAGTLRAAGHFPSVFDGNYPAGALCGDELDRHDHVALSWICTRPAGHKMPHATVYGGNPVGTLRAGMVLAKWTGPDVDSDLIQWSDRGIK